MKKIRFLVEAQLSRRGEYAGKSAMRDDIAAVADPNVSGYQPLTLAPIKREFIVYAEHAGEATKVVSGYLQDVEGQALFTLFPPIAIGSSTNGIVTFAPGWEGKVWTDSMNEKGSRK